MSLDGKVAWIAGVGGGEDGEVIGRAVALALSARGVRVLVTGPVERALGVVVGEVAHGGGKARHLVTPVADPAGAKAAVARALEAFGRIDFVVACAGGVDGARPEPAPLAALMNAYCTFAAARPSLHDEGRLVAIAGAGASAGASVDEVAASAARAALVGLVTATAREVSAQRVTCNALFFPVASDGSEGDDARTPLGRPVAPEDVAELVVFLCGTGGASLTGQSLAVGAADRAGPR
jgi:NAD(P)-dependent dehydrogenase (short-subunit alcohol dehydrogenase family)